MTSWNRWLVAMVGAAGVLLARPVGVRAGGASDAKRALLGWAPDGLAYVVREVISLAGDQPELSVVEVGGAHHGRRLLCGGRCTPRSVKRALRSGDLVPSEPPPPGVRARVRQRDTTLLFEIHAGGRWHRLGKEAFTESATLSALRLVETAWSPTRHVVAFKVYLEIDWGGGMPVDHKELIYAFVLPSRLARRLGVKPLTKDVALWKGRRKVRIQASSTLFEGSPTRYRPANLLRGPWPWCEGAPGAGHQSTITYELGAPVRITGFRIKPGFFRTAKLWRLNNRVMQIRLQTDGAKPERAFFADKRKRFTIPLRGGPRTVRRVTFTIETVYTGASPSSNDTCITELRPF